MISFLESKAWQAVLSGFLGILIGSSTTLVALSPEYNVLHPSLTIRSAKAEEPGSPPGTDTVPPPTEHQFSPPPEAGQPPFQPSPERTGHPFPEPGQFSQFPEPRQGEQPHMPQPSDMPQGQFPRPGESFSPPPGENRSEGQFPNQFQDHRSDEELNKEREEREKRQKEMEAEQVKRIKQDIKHASREFDKLKRSFNKHAAKGVTVPQECLDAQRKGENIVAAVDKATNFEEIEASGIDELRDEFETLNDCREKIEMLARWPKALKTIDRRVKQLETRWNRTKKKAPEEVREDVTLGDAALKAIRQAITRAKDLIKAGDIEEVEFILEDDIFGKFDDVEAAIQGIEAVTRTKQFMASFPRTIRVAEATIAKHKAEGKDTSAMEELLAKSKTQYQFVKTLKPGSEEYIEAIMELVDISQEGAAISGGTEDVDALFGEIPSSAPLPNISLPEGF